MLNSEHRMKTRSLRSGALSDAVFFAKRARNEVAQGSPENSAEPAAGRFGRRRVKHPLYLLR